MKKFVVSALFVAVLPSFAFASFKPSYVSANIKSVEALPDSSGGTQNDYLVSYWIQPCAQRLTKLEAIRLPSIDLDPSGPEKLITNASIVVVLFDSGLQCAGPTELATVIYQADRDVQNPRPLKP